MSRKQFIKALLTIVLLPFLYFWKSISDDRKNDRRFNKFVNLKNDFPLGISFTESFIIYKTNNDLKIYSSKCSHLGCKIKKVENDEIVCPCHGSKYDLHGNVIKGPSTKPLIELNYKIGKHKNEIVVDSV